jgi:hypothetical protein
MKIESHQSQAESLLGMLFDPTDRVEVRRIGKGGAKKVFFDSWTEVVYEWDAIRSWNRSSHIYFGVNPRESCKGTDDDVATARCVFIDIDGTTDYGEVQKRIGGLPEPSAVVMSGGGFHLYWMLDAPVTDMVHWRQLQKAIINRCNSDRSVHNPSRIMRLPGTENIKQGRGACVLLECKPENRYGTDWIVELGLPEPETTVERIQQNILNAKWQSPTRATLEWINRESPVGEGHRNRMLFNAAVELLGNGWDWNTIVEACTQAALRDGLDQEEIDQTLESASSRPRTPSPNNIVEREPMVTGVGKADIERTRADTDDQDEDEKPKRAEVGVGRRTLMNTVYTRSQAEDGKMRHFYKPIEQIEKEVGEYTGGWPKKVGGLLVVPGADASPGMIPSPSCFRYLLSHDQLFAWLYEVCHPHWHTGQVFDAATHEPRSAVTKREFFEYLKGQPDEYEAYSALPHEPMMQRTLYAACELPEGPTGKLDELIATTNGETDEDRDLIRAMIVTGIWGGLAGARPMFVLRSRYGKGTGKSVTAGMAARISGWALSVSAKEKWENIAKRMFSPSSMQGRVVTLDNVKGRLSNEELESAITSSMIEGHMMYQGNTRRPNTLTWIVTSNTPNMSTDLAVRSVIIDIGKQKHENAGYHPWVESFCDRYRAELVADCVWFLSQPPKCRIDAANADRFGAWQSAVLSRFPNGNELAAKIIASRSEVDGEGADLEDMADYLKMLMRRHSVDPDTTSVRLSRRVVHQWLTERCGVDLSSKGVVTLLKDGMGSGELSPLKETKYGGQRCWVWKPVPGEPKHGVIDSLGIDGEEGYAHGLPM